MDDNILNSNDLFELEDRKKLAKLVIVEGGTVGREFPIYKERVLIGRWDSRINCYPEIDLSEEDISSRVSRVHAFIYKKGNDFYLADLCSKNGTYLNKEFRLIETQSYKILEDYKITIGDITFKFEIL
jgi:hypothetical protein